jgi:hypothetical protein
LGYRPGLVGSALIEQLASQAERLSATCISICGCAG